MPDGAGPDPIKGSSAATIPADTPLDPGSSSATKPRRTLTRDQLAARIAQGETLVLHRRRIYKLDSWLSRHPGGDLAILHFVGRDAGDEIEAYHCDETLRRMRAFVIAELDEEDWRGKERPDGTREGYKPLVPPVQLGYRKGKLDHPDAQLSMWQQRHRPELRLEEEQEVEAMMGAEKVERASPSVVEQLDDEMRPQSFPLPVHLLEPPADPPGMDPVREAAISRAYQALHAEVKASGLYTLRPAGYGRECVRYATLGALAFYFWYNAKGRTSWYLASSFFLGLFWHQLTFTAHDAGHTGITHIHWLDRLIGVIIADYIGGLSLGWWCDNHDVHHLVTNHPEHDPDIQHMPFFAISPRFLPGAPANAEAGDKGTGSQGLWSSYYRRVLVFDPPARVFLKVQHKLYYIIMSLGRFNLYANSYGYLALKARADRWRTLELVGITVFWTWYGTLLSTLPSWGLRIAYLLISHIVTSPLHVQVRPSLPLLAPLFLHLPWTADFPRSSSTPPDRALPLCTIVRRPRLDGKFRLASNPYNNGRRLPTLPGLPPRRAAHASSAPPLPASASAQSPRSSGSVRRAFLQRVGTELRLLWICGGEWEGVGRVEERGESGQGYGQGRSSAGEGRDSSLESTRGGGGVDPCPRISFWFCLVSRLVSRGDCTSFYLYHIHSIQDLFAYGYWIWELYIYISIYIHTRSS